MCGCTAPRSRSKDNDKQIEKRELATCLQAILGKELAPRQLNAVWDFLNPDMCDSIEFGEFHRWLHFGSAEDEADDALAEVLPSYVHYTSILRPPSAVRGAHHKHYSH